ncbi:HAD-IB family hydrolase [Adlercreutzia sp. ZJ304]|uniref:HAD family hydrolase n=1 Tax=Adlercreutzia sp. ZJ304 TaxID=2709791 RepID=UPI0013E9EEB0|nr:HAD-IB family hydrolase [Adlercreutzia sp. ZJ304]
MPNDGINQIEEMTEFAAPNTDDAPLCNRETLLPAGIVRVTEEAIAAQRLVPENLQNLHGNAPQRVTIAAFDFDGTCISGSSPKKLVDACARARRIPPYKLLRIALWGLAYKLNLPKDGEGVRTRVFSAFKGLSAATTNDYLCKFYKNKIAPMYRTDADAAMHAHLQAGHVVVLVSASFEPIIAAAMLDHPIEFALASRMKIDEQGCYTDQVNGLTTEGPDKIIVLEQFANKYFGQGNWELGWAYGDHFSDVAMLEAATHPCAVTPDGKLRRFAQQRGWEILDWQ